MPEEEAIAGQGTGQDVAEDVTKSKAEDAVEDVVEDAARRDGAAMRLPTASAPARRSVADELYGPLPVARWAQALLDLPPFARLAGVSLSD
ncbi:MAG TPA: hypothetical protein VF739_00505, partial [Ktedonobacterales bacterium]